MKKTSYTNLLLALPIVFLLIGSNSFAALNGTYTNSSESEALRSNYMTVNSAVTGMVYSQTPVAYASQVYSICAGSSTILTTSTTGKNYWYDAPYGGNLLSAGDTFITGILNSNTSYFIESCSTIGSSITTTYNNNHSLSGGNMFDITANTDLFIDSFGLHLNNAGTVSTVEIYYKVGSHIGFETNSAAWILLGKVNVTSAGIGIPTSCAVGGLTIPAGQTYGIYVINPDMVSTTLNTTYTSAELSLTAGTGLNGLFSGTNFSSAWNGTVYYRSNNCSSQREEVIVTVNSYPIINIPDITNCGPVILDAGYGNGYTYNWSDGNNTQTTNISSSGTYYVSINNHGCISSDTTVVTIKPVPMINLGKDLRLCGGSVLLDAQNSGASYLWNDNSALQNLSVNTTGTYWVKVTNAFNCMSSDTINITINPVPLVDLGEDIIQCGGTVILDAQNTGAMYLWNDQSTSQTLKVNSTGTYSVKITDDNNCTNTDKVDVTIYEIPIVDLGIDVAQCGGSVTLDAKNNGASYKWNDNSTSRMLAVNSTGTYSVMVTDKNNCRNSDSIFVTINSIPNISIEYPNSSVCSSDGNVLLNGYPQGGIWSGIGVFDNSFNTEVGKGTYLLTYTYTDSNLCSNSETVSIDVVICTGIDETNLSVDFKFYPNPNNGTFNLNMNSNAEELSIVIFDVFGRVVYTALESNVSAGYSKQINLDNQSSGLYEMHLYANGEERISKIMINK